MFRAVVSSDLFSHHADSGSAGANRLMNMPLLLALRGVSQCSTISDWMNRVLLPSGVATIDCKRWPPGHQVKKKK